MKHIGDKFKKKKNLLSKQNNRQFKITNTIYSFLEGLYGDVDIKKVLDINYNISKNFLTIETKNKIFASEVSLRLDDLQNYIKKENIKLDRIIIR